MSTPPRLEHQAEHERVGQKQNQRVEKRPEQTEERALLAAGDLSAGKLADQITMSPEVPRQGDRVQVPDYIVERRRNRPAFDDYFFPGSVR